MDQFILNLIHRPEMVPEYSATVTGQGKEEDIGDKALLTESLDIFKTQQRLAHENGLKVTIQMTYASLFNDEAVEIAKHDHDVYGDEIALSLLGLPCEEFREKYKTKDFCIWMFSMEDKKAIVNDVFEKFHDRFGVNRFLLHGCRSDQLYQGNLSDRKVCGCHLLGGRPESLPYLQQLLVHVIRRRPMGTVDPVQAEYTCTGSQCG